jgi:bis(5'-nucleosyl)-tetraphosphatase (symmetrical)
MSTIFIGDIHGCAAEFEELLGKTGFRRGRDRLLLTGDAFSRGPDPSRVWELIEHTGAEMVLGNHDDRLLSQLRRRRGGQDPGFRGASQRQVLDLLEPDAGRLLPWLQQRPLWIEADAFILVHAGVNPEKGLAHTSREEFLKIRTWPPRDGLEGERWHDYYQPQENVLVFGHDAPGGVIIKRRPNGIPYLVGLDSGCVYGGWLSAWILEEERLIQVVSRLRA